MIFTQALYGEQPNAMAYINYIYVGSTYVTLIFNSVCFCLVAYESIKEYIQIIISRCCLVRGLGE